MKITVGLLRVSTDKQDTELQKGEILNYCNTHNLKVDKWIENIESGKKKKLNNMQGIKEIKKLVQDNSLGKLIVYRQDRISRRAIEVLNFIDELNKQGVEVYATNKGKIETDKIGLVVSFMDAYISEIEVENTRERITDKLKTKNENNQYAGGNINFGYQYNRETKNLEINEEEASIVRYIFDEYMIKGVVTIARELREKSIKKRAVGGRMVDFSPGSLTKMIDNQIYIGKKEYNKNFRIIKDGEEIRREDCSKIKTQDYNPKLRIISDEIFLKAQALKVERHNKTGGCRRLNRSKELLEGLVWHRCSDGNIRKMYISYNYDKRNGKGTAVFKCNDCQHFKRDGQKSFVTYRIDDAVIQYIKSFSTSINRTSIEDILKQQRQEGKEDILKQLEVHKKNLEKYTKRNKIANEELEKYFDGESGLTSDKINDMIDDSKLEMNNSKNQIAILERELASKEVNSKQVEDLLNLYSTFNDVYEKANFDQRRFLLRETIDKIIVEKGKIEVIYKLNNFFNIIP